MCELVGVVDDGGVVACVCELQLLLFLLCFLFFFFSSLHISLNLYANYFLSFTVLFLLVGELRCGCLGGRAGAGMSVPLCASACGFPAANHGCCDFLLRHVGRVEADVVVCGGGGLPLGWERDKGGSLRAASFFLSACRGRCRGGMCCCVHGLRVYVRACPVMRMKEAQEDYRLVAVTWRRGAVVLLVDAFAKGAVASAGGGGMWMCLCVCVCVCVMRGMGRNSHKGGGRKGCKLHEAKDKKHRGTVYAWWLCVMCGGNMYKIVSKR